MDTPVPPSWKDVGTTDPLSPPILLNEFTSARLAFIVSKTGKSPLDLIAAALELLWPGAETVAGIPATPTPPDAVITPPGYREAWRSSLGWTEEDTPPPTMDDLLPPDMLRKSLDLWLSTGTNVLYTHVQSMFGAIDEGGFEATKLVTDSMEVDILGRLEELRAKWEGGKAA